MKPHKKGAVDRSAGSKIKSKPAVEKFFQILGGCFQSVNSRIKRRSAKAGLLEGKLMEQQDNDRQEIDNSRLARAKRKLERLKREYSAQISRVFDHQAQTNGQPMNDKANGRSF